MSSLGKSRVAVDVERGREVREEGKREEGRRVLRKKGGEEGGRGKEGGR